jgi:integrase
MPKNFDFQTLLRLSIPGRYTDPSVKGLHLWVKPSLKKYWIYRYTLAGKRHNVSLGAFPNVSIKDARVKAQRALVGLAEGADPRRTRKAAVKVSGPLSTPTFEEFATAWIDNNQSAWTNDKHAHQWRYTLRDFAFPVFGKKQLNEIDETDVLKVLQPIWHSKTETASRLRGRLERIFSAARVQKLRDGINPATWKGHLDAVLPSPKLVKRQRGEKHHRALPYRLIPQFMADLREQEGIAALALEFLILNANRTSEVLLAKWGEIEGDLWIIPASRMKAKKEHRVPLCRRSLEILSVAKSFSLVNSYIFSSRDRPLSNMSMSAVLKRMNIDATVHGFRSVFRDWVAEETDHSPEVAEMALAHTITNRVEAAYRRGDLLERRRKLMENWQGYCESLPSQNILNLKAA